MKKVYNNPMVNVLAIDAEDIITASTSKLNLIEDDPQYGMNQSMGKIKFN